MDRHQKVNPNGVAIRFSSGEASFFRWKEIKMATATMAMYVAKRSHERKAAIVSLAKHHGANKFAYCALLLHDLGHLSRYCRTTTGRRTDVQ